jgi:hypothetical protein
VRFVCFPFSGLCLDFARFFGGGAEVLIIEKWSTSGRFLLFEATGEEDNREGGEEGIAGLGLGAYVFFTCGAMMGV